MTEDKEIFTGLFPTLILEECTFPYLHTEGPGSLHRRKRLTLPVCDAVLMSLGVDLDGQQLYQGQLKRRRSKSLTDLSRAKEPGWLVSLSIRDSGELRKTAQERPESQQPCSKCRWPSVISPDQARCWMNVFGAAEQDGKKSIHHDVGEYFSELYLDCSALLECGRREKNLVSWLQGLSWPVTRVTNG